MLVDPRRLVCLIQLVVAHDICYVIVGHILVLMWCLANRPNTLRRVILCLLLNLVQQLVEEYLVSVAGSLENLADHLLCVLVDVVLDLAQFTIDLSLFHFLL